VGASSAAWPARIRYNERPPCVGEDPGRCRQLGRVADPARLVCRAHQFPHQGAQVGLALAGGEGGERVVVPQ
jgi:hypothetical protein